jgi:hypothetical protein
MEEPHMHTLILTMSQDRAGTDGARCVVTVDQRQVGDVLTVTAERGTATQDFELRGDWQTGHSTLQINFLNDTWVNDPEKPSDRNLYLEQCILDGLPVPFMPKPLHMNEAGPCPPIGMQVGESQFSIRAAFAEVNAKLDAIMEHLRIPQPAAPGATGARALRRPARPRPSRAGLQPAAA